MKKLLIISHSNDPTVVALADLLSRQGRIRAECITDTDLITAPDWRVWLTTATADWQLTLADGRVFSQATVDTMYCRITYLPPATFATPVDTQYAQAEWYALVAGWLQNMGHRRLGALSPTTLAAGTANPLLRLHQLAQAGLPVADMIATTLSAAAPHQSMPTQQTGSWQQEPLTNRHESILATGQLLTGPLVQVFGDGVRRLQQQLDCELLQVHFTQTIQGRWKATNYQTLVQTDSADERLALADYLTQATLHASTTPLRALSSTQLTPTLP